MLLLENKRDVSGMFSKAGRISYERHHVFQRKKQIMNPDDEKKKVIPYVNVVEQLEKKFGGKLSVALNKKNTIEQQLKLLEMYQNEKMDEDKNKRREKKLEPFELMRTREIFKPDIVKKEPEPGTYNPRYESVYQRVKSVPKFKTKRTLPRIKKRGMGSIEKIEEEAEGDNDQLDSLINDYESDFNNKSLFHDKSQIYNKTKGSYKFQLMSGRTRHGFLEFFPNPHESRFEKRHSMKKRIKGENKVNFDKYTSRYKRKGNKADYSTPYYNPSYKLIEKRRTKGTLDFSKFVPRKDDEKEYYCQNDYDISRIEKGVLKSESVPNFAKMSGRYANRNRK